jgi:hypothetical protein
MPGAFDQPSFFRCQMWMMWRTESAPLHPSSAYTDAERLVLVIILHARTMVWSRNGAKENRTNLLQPKFAKTWQVPETFK